MRIGIYFNGPSLPATDGVTHRSIHMIEALRDSGADLRLYFGDCGLATDAQLASLGIPAAVFPGHWFMDYPERVAGLMKEDGIDVLHAMNSEETIPYWGFEIAKLVGVPLIADFHDCQAHMAESFGYDRSVVEAAARMQTYATTLVAHSICMSTVDHREFLELGVDPDVITYIPHGIDLDPAPPARFGSPDAVLFVGNMEYGPNFEAVSFLRNDVAPKVWNALPATRFIAVGRRNPAPLATDERFVLTGEVTSIESWLDGVGVSVAPIFSGSGMKTKLLTYASLGLPVIATGDALAGYEAIEGFIARQTADGFAEAIVSFLTNADSAKAAAAKIRESLDKTFSWQENVQQLNRIYEQAIAEHPHSRIPDEMAIDMIPPVQPWLEMRNEKSRRLSVDYVRRLNGASSNG